MESYNGKGLMDKVALLLKIKEEIILEKQVLGDDLCFSLIRYQKLS